MKWALITGASSGIGRALALIAAEQQYRLILLARRRPQLEQLAAEIHRSGGRAVVLKEDLSDPQAIPRLAQQIPKISNHLDLLINNAGFGLAGEFWQQDMGITMDMLQVNMHALVALTHICLPLLQKVSGARILNISSAGGFQPLPYMAAYGASKAFVTSFSQALGEELRSSGISLTAFCPGPVKTEFGQALSVHSTQQFLPHRTANAQITAKKAFHAAMQRKAVAIYPFSFSITTFLTRFLPRNLTTWISGRLMRYWMKGQ